MTVLAGYPKFISLLTSRVPLRVSSNISKSGPTLEERILALLSSALSNVVREVDFFKQTAQENGLDITKQSKNGFSVESDLTGPVTKAYTDFMVSTAATGSLSDGLVVLWATEKVRGATSPSRYKFLYTYLFSVPSATSRRGPMPAHI
jgi:hypothetical protein